LTIGILFITTATRTTAAESALADKPATVTVKDMRLAFERQEETLLVKQMISLVPNPGAGAARFSFPLPTGALDAALVEDNDGAGVDLDAGKRLLTGTVPEKGRTIALTFLLPILDGTVVFDQQLGTPARLVHAALLWPADSVRLVGQGFSQAESDTTPSGMPALFTVAGNLEDGHVQLLLTGLTGTAMQRAAMVATISSFAILLFGLMVWMRRSITRKRPTANKTA
jgi:hypothetical protein